MAQAENLQLEENGMRSDETASYRLNIVTMIELIRPSGQGVPYLVTRNP